MNLSSQLVDRGAVPASLGVIEWFLFKDVVAKTRLNAVEALRKIHTSKANDLLLSILSPPHPNSDILVIALNEVSHRNLECPRTQLLRLAGHYRSAVREAAREVMDKQGHEPPPDYLPEEALVQWFDEDLQAAEDYDLWLRITAFHSVHFIPEPLVVKHGGHAGQLSHTVPAIDRFRVQAIVKILGNPDLIPEYRNAAVTELLRKCRILALGCEKRGKLQDARHYRELAQRYRL